MRAPCWRTITLAISPWAAETRFCKSLHRLRRRDRSPVPVLFSPQGSISFASPSAMDRPPSEGSVQPAALASTPKPACYSLQLCKPRITGIVAVRRLNIAATRLPTFATRIFFALLSLWPISDHLVTCDGRKGCIKSSQHLRGLMNPISPQTRQTSQPSNYNQQMTESGSLATKRQFLEGSLAASGHVLVAYSGGVDSAYLAWAAHRALGDTMLAVIADSASLARTQLADAIAFANEQEIPIEVIATSELDRPDYARNDGQRCFHCKDELFSVMEGLRAARGFDLIVYGVNLDDQGDFRPGQNAARQHNIATPLLAAGLTKQDIRDLAREAGLRIWDKPASACLSSRIEYGRPVTREALSVVEQGEDALRALGFRRCRVRHHGEIVRIEIAREELSRALDPAMAAEFARVFKALGFKFVTLDLEGFRSGSMNALLPINMLRKPAV